MGRWDSIPFRPCVPRLYVLPVEGVRAKFLMRSAGLSPFLATLPGDVLHAVVELLVGTQLALFWRTLLIDNFRTGEA